MNRYTGPSTLALVLALGPATWTAAAQEGHHDAHHAGDARHEAVLQIPANHVRWAPDAPLKEGMARVRLAVAELGHHEMGHLDAGRVRALAGEVDAAIGYMFTHCRLPPEPDIALHAVLARLMAGTRDLHEDPADAAPVAAMRAALADYADLFDDPAVPPAP